MEDISYVGNRRRFTRSYPDYGYPYIGRYYADPQAIAPRQVGGCNSAYNIPNGYYFDPYYSPPPQGTIYVNPYQIPPRYSNLVGGSSLLVDPFYNPYRNQYYNPYYNGPYVYRPNNSPYVSYLARTSVLSGGTPYNANLYNPYTGLYNPYYLY